MPPPRPLDQLRSIALRPFICPMMVCSVEYTLSSILLTAANQIFCCVHDLFFFTYYGQREKNSMLRHRFIGGCACTKTQMGSCASNSTKAYAMSTTHSVRARAAVVGAVSLGRRVLSNTGQPMPAGAGSHGVQTSWSEIEVRSPPTKAWTAISVGYSDCAMLMSS